MNAPPPDIENVQPDASVDSCEARGVVIDDPQPQGVHHKSAASLEEEEAPLSREEVAFLRSRYLDSRSVTVLASLPPEEIRRIRVLIRERLEEEKEIAHLIPDEVDEDLYNEDVLDGEETDEDGLGKTTSVSRDHRWPFKKRTGDEEDEDSTVDKIALFDAISCHDKGEDSRRTISRYKKIIRTEATTAQDDMFRMFAFVNLGMLRISSIEYKDENEAVKCFKVGALVYEEPVSIYFYGQALVHGVGGTRRNVPKGIGLLNKAGSKGIGQAYFELGTIYERGVSTYTGGSVYKNEARSRDFYRAAGKCYLENLGPLGDWKFKLYAAETFTADVSYLKSLLPTDVWHGVEDILTSVVGNRFSWSIAGQAFLFGAAASLTSHAEMRHYAPLLILLPILGMTMAFFSTLHIIEAIFRNDRRRGSVLEMLDAKIDAYRSHLNAAEKAAKENAERYKDSTQRIMTEREGLNHHEATVKNLRVLSSTIEVMLVIVQVGFFVAWLVLFFNESAYCANGCSNWWGARTCSNRIDG